MKRQAKRHCVKRRSKSRIACRAGPAGWLVANDACMDGVVQTPQGDAERRARLGEGTLSLLSSRPERRSPFVGVFVVLAASSRWSRWNWGWLAIAIRIALDQSGGPSLPALLPSFFLIDRMTKQKVGWLAAARASTISVCIQSPIHPMHHPMLDGGY